jgi:hypothetical protein
MHFVGRMLFIIRDKRLYLIHISVINLFATIVLVNARSEHFADQRPNGG